MSALHHRRAWRGVLGAATASVVLLASACATSSPSGEGATDEPHRFAVDVDVDTPELRAAKESAGIADCPSTDPARQSIGQPAGKPMPQLTLPCLGGGPEVNLADLRGPLVVNLWAQWCGPCREELPYYQRLHERGDGQVSVLGIDYEDTRPAWAIELLRDTGVTYPSLADPGGEIGVPFRVRGLPGIVFVDVDGSVVAVEFVVIRSYEQLTDLVEQHLGVAVGAAG